MNHKSLVYVEETKILFILAAVCIRTHTYPSTYIHANLKLLAKWKNTQTSFIIDGQ